MSKIDITLTNETSDAYQIGGSSSISGHIPAGVNTLNVSFPGGGSLAVETSGNKQDWNPATVGANEAATLTTDQSLNLNAGSGWVRFVATGGPIKVVVG